MVDLKSMYIEELTDYLKHMGQPAFRAKQLFSWMHEKYVASVDEMTNLPKGLRAQINEQGFTVIEEETRQTSKKDDTIKFLFRLQDGQMIETVFMRYSYGNSVCISSQAGCRMGCSFCASTIGGLVRNLTASEMLEQVYACMRITGERVSNVVVMGTGEPLDNYDNVMRFLELVTDKKGLNISMRHISLSTCGVVPRIYELAEKKLGLTLSISLHAPNDKIRSQTMPVNSKWNIEELLTACRYYTKVTSRRISFEYAMIDSFNDSVECAEELASRLSGMLCHINLIPVNNVRENNYERSNEKNIKRFISVLERHGLTVTVRRTLGSDINASCGQLRAKKENL